MHSDPTLPQSIPVRRLRGVLHISDLSGAERLVIGAIRAGWPSSRPGRSVAVAADQETDELRDLHRVVERYLARQVSPATDLHDDATEATLGAFESHTLHALACLQAGLLGEAWKSLVPVWGTGEAGKALVRLQDVADALQLRDRRLERWHFDPAFFREAALI